MNPSSQPWGAIFDWDGVIIDSSGPHQASWQRLAEQEGRRLPADHFLRGFGRRNEDIIPNILGWSRDPNEIDRIAQKKEALYRAIVREQGMEPLPGVRTWLRALKEASIPCAVGSSTERLNIDCVLELTGLEKFFDAIVSADDVTQGKPNPQVFLLAAKKLGLAPERCVVFEDALVGIEAARAAGMKVVGVASTREAEELKDADVVVERLDRLSVRQIQNGFAP